MEKYSGNQKGFIYASFDAKDQKEVFEKYLEPIAKEGVRFCWSDACDRKEEDNIARSNAVMLFLTKDYAREEKLRKTVEAAVRNDKPILSVYLEDMDLDAGLSMQLESQQALFRSRYKSDEEFTKELKNAAIFDKVEVTEQQKKKQKRRSVIAVAAALIVVLVLAAAIKPMLAPKANAETMEAMGLQGLSKSELEKMVSFRMIGRDVIKRESAWIIYPDGNTNQLKYKYEEDQFGDNAITTGRGQITDLNGIQQLKNLTLLQLTGQQITDATPAFELEKLNTLILSFNPIESLDGAEKLKELKELDISNTNVRELPDDLHVQMVIAEASRLSRIPDFGGLEDVCLQAGQTNITDVSNAGTAASYKMLAMNCEGLTASRIVSALDGVPVEELSLDGIQISSLKDISGLNVTKTLRIGGAPLSSLEGIEDFEGIEELDVKNCQNLTDLSALNGIESLDTVRITDDMKPLAETLDNRIHVVVDYREYTDPV